MSLAYTFKRLVRSWQLYIALLLGIVLAATFFAGINVGADTAARQAVDQALSQTPVDLTMYTYGLSPENITDAMQRIGSVDYVKGVEALSSFMTWGNLAGYNLTYPLMVMGISQSSKVYEGWVGGAPSLNENETYVWLGSAESAKFQAGRIVPINMTSSYWNGSGNEVKQSFLMNLKVAGFAQFEGNALKIVSGQAGSFSISGPFGGYSFIMGGGSFQGNVLIVSWEKTLVKQIDLAQQSPAVHLNPFSTQILVYLDRDKLVTPWDISGSITRVNSVTDKIAEKIFAYNLQSTNMLSMILTAISSTLSFMRFMFTIISLPVFFVAWYMGSTVSDVSFNLRRREIGLLLTKGFSRRQLLGIFLSEAVAIGLLGGAIGMGLGIVLNPLFVRASGGIFAGTPSVSWDIVFMTVGFGVTITLLAVFRSARKASNLPAVDALREYMYVEETKPYKKTWPWIAFALGTYKIVIIIFGINMSLVMQRVAFSGNMLLSIFAGLAFLLDLVLTFIGPWLFIWGVVKLFIRGSFKFQELTSRAFKFAGELGALATKSVQRNPARSAAAALLVSLIIAYSFLVTGVLASEQDFAVRNVLFDVGSDISVTLSGGKIFQNGTSSATFIENVIKKNMSDLIASSTIEYSSSAGLVQNTIRLKAIDPDNWADAAYYESTWFSGRDIQAALDTFKANNNTIILERGFALMFDKKIDDSLSISLFGQVNELKIAGFFGNEPSSSIQSSYAYFRTYWSYVPMGLLQSQDSSYNYDDATVLIKLKAGVSGKQAADTIQNLKLNVANVQSAEQRLEETQGDVVLNGMLNVLHLGVIFVILASTVGTALVTLVSLKERGREASIMSVRGLSYKQLVSMLLTENLAIVIFAVLLGALVGIIAVPGVLTLMSGTSETLVRMRLVFPVDATLTLISSIVLIFASIIIPVLFMAKRYGSRLERIVRQA